MKSQERQQVWQRQIAAWLASDLSGAAFCKQYDVNYGQFNYWRKKLQQVEPTEVSAGFAQVTPLVATPCNSSGELSVHLPSGIRFSGLNASNVDVVVALLRQV